MALGSYPDVSLAQARQRHQDVRRLLADDVTGMRQDTICGLQEENPERASFFTNRPSEWKNSGPTAWWLVQ
jgi:hypothetical protein